MTVQFFDRQDRNNPRNGMSVSDTALLLSWLDEMRNRPPFFCELVGENGFSLLLGVGAVCGCAQHSASDGNPPYLMAVSDEAGHSDEFIEFLIADTPSPVPKRYCLPMEQIKTIAADFIETGERTVSVGWEEI